MVSLYEGMMCCLRRYGTLYLARKLAKSKSLNCSHEKPCVQFTFGGNNNKVKKLAKIELNDRDKIIKHTIIANYKNKQ